MSTQVKSRKLLLHHEIMLLSLRDKEGTVQGDTCSYAIAGAIMTELLLQGRISIGPTKRQLVQLSDGSTTGDEILDETLGRIANSKRSKGLSAWISSIATTGKLKHRVAMQLCDKKVLRNEREKVLWIFSREIYPEINPKYERALKHRMADLMFGQTTKHDERTTILVALAHHGGLLKVNFDKDRLKRNKDRIQKVVAGDMFAARATKSAVEAMQAAMLVAVIIPTVCSN